MKASFLVLVTLGLAMGCDKKPAASPDGTPPPASSTTKNANCGPAQATFSIPSCCGGDLRYFWNGTACVTDAAKCGCSCSGRDCDRFFVAKMQCEQAYATCK